MVFGLTRTDFRSRSRDAFRFQAFGLTDLVLMILAGKYKSDRIAWSLWQFFRLRQIASEGCREVRFNLNGCSAVLYRLCDLASCDLLICGMRAMHDDTSGHVCPKVCTITFTQACGKACSKACDKVGTQVFRAVCCEECSKVCSKVLSTECSKVQDGAQKVY